MDQNSQVSELEQTDVTDVAEVAEETSSPDVTDGSSSSDGAVEEQDAGAVIRDAFLKEYGDHTEAKDEEPSTAEGEVAASSDTERKKPEATETDDSDDEFRISDEEFKALPEGARRRIGELNARAKKAERLYREAQGRMEIGQQAVERVTELENFVKENGIQPQFMAQTFAMTAKFAQGDFESFLEAVTPFVEHARQALGQSLPGDLQAKVDEGYLTEEAARELVQARIARQRIEAENEDLRTTQQRQMEVAQRQTALQTISHAVSAREAELMSSDPDYAHLAEAVKEQFAYALEMGARPQNPEQAVEMVNRAYALAKKSAVSQRSQTATPKRPTASTVTRGTVRPASTKEAIINALAG